MDPRIDIMDPRIDIMDPRIDIMDYRIQNPKPGINSGLVVYINCIVSSHSVQQIVLFYLTSFHLD